MTRRKNWDSGNIVEIILSDGRLSYAIIVDKPRIAYYDGVYTERPSVEEIASLPIAFQVWTMRYAVGKKGWQRIGYTEVPRHLFEENRFFKQDLITGALSIYTEGGEEYDATYDEVLGLECAAVWEPVHLISRLEDHYNDIENIWVKSLLPKNLLA